MRLFGIFAALVLTTAVGAFAWYYRPLHINFRARASGQSAVVSESSARVFVAQRALVGEIAQFDDALFAFLMFDYLRGRPQLAGRPILLTAQEQAGQTLYVVQVRLPDDLVKGVDILANLKAHRLTSDLRFRWLLPGQLKMAFEETAVFMRAYDGPAERRLREYRTPELEAYLRRFIRFKSIVDPRISGQLDPIPSPLTKVDASRLAANIIAVAQFYDIPIPLFLGIGAMENNYMNVAGDKKNTTWKRHAEPGDIVVRRRGSRVLVRDDSMGVWQITRESLRYAHRLFVRDKRDYLLLPERLRPPSNLQIDSVSPDVLTTYAGLLLRNLLDRFGGNVTLTAGAYNGGPGKPNLHYAEGVELVANYARRVIGRAAAMDRVALEEQSINPEKMHKHPEEVLSARTPATGGH